MTGLQQGIALLLACVPLLALAEGGTAACRADAQKFCVPARGGAFECLLDHQQEISDRCYDALKAQILSERSAATETRTAPVHAVYKSRMADGRIVYGDTIPLNAASKQEVENRLNVSLPFR